MNSQSPIACDLSAIDDNKLENHRKNGRVVFDAISEIREIPNGYSFKLPADTDVITRAGAFVARERLCCPFFEFTLNIQVDQQPIWLKLTGREGVKPYIKRALLPKLDAPIVN